MKLSEYCDCARGVASRLASDLDVPAALISQWASGVRPVPIERCVAIERATKAFVTRKDLRPLDWQAIWPELDEETPCTPELPKAA